MSFQDSAQSSADEASDEAEDLPMVTADPETLKTRIETLDLSARTLTALEEANIRTLGGLVRKRKDDILALDGIGPKGVDEIESILKDMGYSLQP